MSNGDEKAVRDRAPMAHQTVDKVASGITVKSWGTLVAEHGVEPSVLRQVQGLLGIQDSSAPQRDDAFFDALLEKHRYRPSTGGGPPTDLQYDAQLRAEINRRARSSDPTAQVERETLKRLLKGTALVEPGENAEMALGLAVQLLVAVCPEASIEQHERRLLASAGHLAPEIRTAIQGIVELNAERQSAATEFERDSDGVPRPMSQRNFDIASARTGWMYRYDLFADRKQVKIKDGEWEVVQDRHLNDWRWTMQEEHGLLMPEKEVHNLFSHRSLKAAFHPVLDYLNGSKQWDTTPRVGGLDSPSWLTTYCGVKDSAYVRAVGRLVLCAAVRRVRQPGCKYDEMVILEGPQGGRKSSMWRFLCPTPEWFTDDFSFKYDTKQIMEITKGKWIIECPELKGKTDGDMSHLKALLSRNVEVSRMAYGREAEERPRQFILVGTTNESEYLQDLTGDRRYWPVEVGFIDLEALLRDRDQIWAEANFLEQQHPEDSFIRLDPSLYDAARHEQRLRRIEDPHVVVLTKYLHRVTGAVRIEDVWKLLGHHEEKLPSRYDQGRIAAALNSMGWRKREPGDDGVIRYERGTETERSVELRLDGGAVQGYKLKVSGVAPAPQPESIAPQVVVDRSN